MTISFVSEPTKPHFQRSSKTGGQFGVGENSTECEFNVTFTGAAGEYGLFDYDPDGDVVGSQLTSYTSFSSGAAFTVTVPARTGYYKLGVREDGGAPSYSTSFFGCGFTLLLVGQSIASNQAFNSDSSLASNGIVASPFARGLFDRNGTYSWSAVGDGTEITSGYAATYLREKIALENCNGALIGFARFGIRQSTLIPTGTNWASIEAVLSEAVAWEAAYYHQGHDDASQGYSSTFFMPGIHWILDEFQKRNAYPNQEEFISTVVNINTVYNNATAERLNNIRIAGKRVAEERANAIHFEMSDIETEVDNIHPTQLGCERMAIRHLRQEYGDDQGPIVSGYSKTGTTVTINFTFNGSANTLVEQGDATNYVNVALASSPYTPLPKNSITVNATTIQVELTSDPGEVELVPIFATEQNNNGVNYVSDNYSDSFSSAGRELGPTLQENAQLEANADLTEELNSGALTYSSDGVSATGGARLRSEAFGGMIPSNGPFTFEFDLLTTATQTFNYVLSMQNGYEFFYDTAGSITSRVVDGVVAVAPGSFQRFAVQFDGISVGRLFLDGVQIGENLAATPRVNDDVYQYLLAFFNQGQNHDGTLRNFAVYRNERYTSDGYTPEQVDTTDFYLWCYYPLTEGPQAATINRLIPGQERVTEVSLPLTLETSVKGYCLTDMQGNIVAMDFNPQIENGVLNVTLPEIEGRLRVLLVEDKINSTGHLVDGYLVGYVN